MLALLLRLAAHPLARFVALACMAVIIILSLLPGNGRPHTGASGNLEHMMAYAGTAFLAAMSMPFWRHWRLIVLATCASGLFEIIQIWIPGRHAGVDNWLASASGATLGLGVALGLFTLLTPPEGS